MKEGLNCERLVGRWALRITWHAVVVTFFCFVFSMYLIFMLVNDQYLHNWAWYERPAPCITPKFIMDGMIELTFTVSDLLGKLNISHAICYGTLWGALREGAILPWDNNVDFCVLKNEIEKVSVSTLQEQFRANNMDLSYNHRHGEYSVLQGPAKAIITVFYLTPFDEIFQDGFEHRFLWFFQERPVSFPSRLLEPPLPKGLLHNRQIPVPHDGIEILKYLFAHDWWLEKPPPGCERKKS